jgi:hypothetical protein
MASGNNSDQEKCFRPGKSQAPVNHARLTPSKRVPIETPRTRTKVLNKRRLSKVSCRCFQISHAGSSHAKASTDKGTRTSKAMSSVKHCQPLGRGMKRLKPRKEASAVMCSVFCFKGRGLTIVRAVHELDRLLLEHSSVGKVLFTCFEFTPGGHVGMSFYALVNWVFHVGICKQVLGFFRREPL